MTSNLHNGPTQALVVDDDRDSGRILASALKALGCEALTVSSGQLGAFLEVAGCDVAFVCDSPHGPSCESIAKQIRTSLTTTPRLVLLTSRSISINKLLNAGFDDVFPEPMDQEYLSRLIPMVEHTRSV